MVDHLDPETLPVELAADLVRDLDRIVRVAEAGKTLAARRVEASVHWKRAGHRSPAHWMAAETGTTVGSAVATLETSKALHALAAVDTAMRAGELSIDQANVIAAAAANDRSAERALLDAAKTEDLRGLRQECARVQAAATDEHARYQRTVDRRSLQTCIDPDGAGGGAWTLPPDQHAKVLAALAPHEKAALDGARRRGRDERPEALRADALVALATRTGAADDADGTDGARASAPSSRVAHHVHVRVDATALRRGHTEPGETCEIDGVGPVPVATASAVMGDCLLSAFVTDGADVASQPRPPRPHRHADPTPGAARARLPLRGARLLGRPAPRDRPRRRVGAHAPHRDE